MGVQIQAQVPVKGDTVRIRATVFVEGVAVTRISDPVFTVDAVLGEFVRVLYPHGAVGYVLVGDCILA